MPRRRLLIALALALLALALGGALRSAGDGSTATRPPDPTGEPVERTTVAATIVPAGRRVARVRARVGDLVQLRVVGTSPDSVSVTGYDAVEPLDRESPALFDFVADRAGTFPVRFVSDGRLAGVLLVRPR